MRVLYIQVYISIVIRTVIEQIGQETLDDNQSEYEPERIGIILSIYVTSLEYY